MISFFFFCLLVSFLLSHPHADLISLNFLFQEVEIPRPTAKRAAGKSKKSTGRVAVIKGGSLFSCSFFN